MVLNDIIPTYYTQTLTDKQQIREFYYQDRPLCAYALGDLDEEMWKISSFTGAFDETGELASVALVWKGASLPVYIVVGDHYAAHALMQVEDLPDKLFYMMPARLYDTLQEHFEIESNRRMWRMVVNPVDFVVGPSHPNLRRLTAEDADRIQALFKTDPMRADQITPEVLKRGTFFGIFNDDQEIIALAGTHIYSEGEGVGVIGYVYTHPDERGQGLATTTSGAVAKALIERGIDHVVLNVEQGNSAAIRAYQKLGFRIHAPIVDGVAVKKA